MNKLILTLIFLLCFVTQGFAASQDRLPTGNGTTAAWTGVGSTSGCTATTEWACIDDTIGSPDEATTYISTTASTTRADFVFTPFSISSTAIQNVTVTARCRWSGTGNGVAYTHRLIVNGTSYAQTGSNALSTSWANYSYPWTTNPNTSAAWVEADVEGTGSNPLQQFSFVTNIVEAGEVAECTQGYITVNYTATPTNNMIRFDVENW